jgi:peptide/nickel transport system substrate-binding protein
MRLTRRHLARTLHLVLAAAVAGALAAPVPAAEAQTPKKGGVLRVAERADPVGFDTLGQKKAAVYTQLALTFTHSRLFRYTPTGEVVPDVAEKWAQPSPTTYVITLKKGVLFHNKPPVNGRELTSEDVKFTFERLPGSPEERLFPTLKAVTAPDKYTVRFELSAPASAFIPNLAATTMFIYAKEAGKVGADGARDYTSAETVVGTGPFVLEEYREKQRLVFKRHPQYFEAGKPYLDGVEVYTIPDASAQLAALRSGRIDLIPAGTGQGLAHQMAPEARSIPGAKVLAQRVFQTSENLIGRLDQKPWSDVRVRRAAALSVDREGFMKAIYPEGADPLSGPVPLPSKYFIPLDKLGEPARYYKQDVAAAKKLIAEAGFPNGFKARLNTTPGYGPDYLSRTELLKDMLGKIGIDTSIVVHEYPVWISSVYKGNYEGLTHIPAWTLGDEDEWLGTYLPGDTRNHIHLEDGKITELVKGARQARNEETRAAQIRQFVGAFHDQLYRIYLPQPVLLTVVHSRVKGYVPTVRGYSYPVSIVGAWIE